MKMKLKEKVKDFYEKHEVGIICGIHYLSLIIAVGSTGYLGYKIGCSKENLVVGIGLEMMRDKGILYLVDPSNSNKIIETGDELKTVLVNEGLLK